MTDIRTLSIQRNQVRYVGLFVRPAFPLWGNGAAILQGLYEAFSKFHVGIADFTNVAASANPADQAVTVRLGTNAEYRFGFDRVEATLTNFTDRDLDALPDVLQQADQWLRSVVPEFSFLTHTVAYHSHSGVSPGTSEEVLAALPSARLPNREHSRESGIIYHFDVPERELGLHLTLDHSLSIEDGLFIDYTAIRRSGDIDYVDWLKDLRQELDSALESLGLRLDRQ